MRGIYLVDTTLRDGEQAPSVVFTAEQRAGILGALCAAGVNEVECGTPAMGQQEQATLRGLLRQHGGGATRLTAWCRGRHADLDAAARCGFGAVHVSFALSPVLLRACEKEFVQACTNMCDVLIEATSMFSFVSAGLQDVSRMPADMLDWAVAIIAESGVHRLRLADSVGVWTPLDVQEVMQRIRGRTPGLQLGVHMHNDLGMATANTVVALQMGADAADVTVLGLGERAGNAALEQVVMALERIPDLSHGVQIQALHALCQQVSTAAKYAIPPDQPICGDRVFRHESGIHAAAQLRDRTCFEPFNPVAVGRPGNLDISIGKHSGARAICHVFDCHGVPLTLEEAARLLPRVRSEAIATGSGVPFARLQQLLDEYMHEGREVAA